MHSPLSQAVLFHKAWEVMTSRFPGSVHVVEDNLATHFANIPLFFFNLSVYDAPIADAEALSQLFCVARARGSLIPHASMVTFAAEEAIANWQDVATASGFMPAISIAGMYADDLAPPTRPAPTGLEFRSCSQPEVCADIATVNTLAYHMPAELGRCMNHPPLWQPDSYGAVAYFEGKPVATTGVFPVEGTIYIALVATHPDFERRGFAEAVFRHAAEEGRRLHGNLPLTLHATEAGRPVYEKLGFKAVGTFPIFMPAQA
jgi:GNAT superfamily N-acetyltransferase